MVQLQMLCDHQHYLNNDVHKLVIKDDSPQAVDDALVHMSSILDNHPVEQPLLLFIDARAGVPPLNYFFTELRKVYAAREQLPTIRAVYVYENSVMLSILQAFFNALRMDASRKFMRGGTDIEALDWLLSDAA